jgi:signal transduction histidine kinase
MTGDLLRTKERMEAANRQLIQAEKLASIGRLSATIAHEIRNPLTSVKLNIQKIAQDERLDDIGKEHLSIAQEGISHIEKFIKELLNFTRVSQLSDLDIEAFAEILAAIRTQDASRADRAMRRHITHFQDSIKQHL